MTQINDQRPNLQQKLDSVEKDIVRLENYIVETYKSVQDMTVSSERTDSAIMIIRRTRTEINKLRTEKGKLQAKIDKLSGPTWK